MSETNRVDAEEQRVADDLGDIRDNIERIKADTHAISRVMTLANGPTIIKELTNIIHGSTLKAAILHLTAEAISATALAQALGIDQRNLSRSLEPLREKGYISMSRAGKQRVYKRVELIDLVSFESVPEFARLLSEWESRRTITKEGDSSAEPMVSP